MKTCIQLYCSKPNTYLPLAKQLDNNSLSQLFFVIFSDFRPKEDDFLTHVVSCYNVSFIYHDFKNEMLYIGRSDWELDEEIDAPSDEEFPNYVNETNSCKISVSNYLEFRKNWITLKQNPLPFAIIYRDENDWIDCKGFNSKEEMELFVKSDKSEITH